VRVVVGTWRRDEAARGELLPRPPERLGRLLVKRSHVIAGSIPLTARLRMSAERRLRTLFGEQRWPLAAALTISPMAALPEEQRAAFRRSGLMHILSISGFHVAILAGALIVVLRLCRLPPGQSCVGGTLLVVAYVLWLGAPAPALRSAAVVALWCWARVRQRPPLPAALLAATALAVVVVQPSAIIEPGPWLSFGGVWGCTAAARWWSRVVDESRSKQARRRWRLAGPVAVSVGATLATAPVQLLAFGTLTPIGILANLGAIPLAAAAAGLSLDGLEWVANVAARVPWATFEIAAPGAAAAAAALLALWLLRDGPRRRSPRAVLIARTLTAGGALLAAGCWAPLLTVPGAGSADGEPVLALHFLAVGQGDATAVRTPHGQWLLFDGGPRSGGSDAGARYVVPFLRRNGVRRLAVVVASHGDADHLGGLPAVLEALPVSLALEQGAPDGRPLYHEWLDDITKSGTRWHAARAGERFTIDGVTLRIWHPDSATIAAGWAANENSVVVTVEYGAFRALIGGDAGVPMEALRAAAIGDVSVLKVGHHGSKSASSEAWLAALMPELCVIQVGARNRYGHPNPGVLARLQHHGCAVWRTDRVGDVRITTDGRRATVHSAAGDTTLSLSSEQP